MQHIFLLFLLLFSASAVPAADAIKSERDGFVIEFTPRPPAPPTNHVLLEPVEDSPKTLRFVLENHHSPGRIELRARRFAIRRGELFHIDSTGPGGPFKARAEQDGVLAFSIPIQIRSGFAVSHAPANLLTAEEQKPFTVTGAPGRTTARRIGRVKVQPGHRYLASMRYHMVRGTRDSAIALTWKILRNGRTVSKADNRHYYAFPAYETSAEHPKYCFELIAIEQKSPGDLFELECSVELSGDAGMFRVTEPELIPEPVFARHPGKPKGRQAVCDSAAVARAMREHRIVRPEVRPVAGSPRVFFDGEIQPFLPVWTDSDEQTRTAYAAGCRLFVIKLPVNQWENRARSIWQGPRKYCWDFADQAIARVLQLAPEAKIYLAFSGLAYPGFADDHPAARWRTAEGKTDLKFFNNVPEKAYSLTGPEVRKHIGAFFRALGEHLGQSPLGRRVAAFHLTGGSDGQWYPPLRPWHPKNIDYSEDSRRAAIEELRRMYRNNLERLRRNWQSPELTFERITLPSPEEMAAAPMYLDFRNPRHRRVIETLRAIQTAQVRFIEHLAEEFKTGFGRPVLATTYLPENSSANKTAFMKSRTLDGFVYLPPYLRPRGSGGGCATGHAEASAVLHNKLMIAEIDFRNEYFGIQNFAMRRRYGMADDDAGCLNLMLRNFGAASARGTYGWLRPIGRDSMLAWTGYYRQHLETVFALARTRAATLPDGHETVDVVHFFSDAYMNHLGTAGQFDHLMNYVSRKSEGLISSGLTHRAYLLSDLAAPGRKKGRVYYFTCAADMSCGDIAYIRRELQRDGNVLIFANDVGRSNEWGFTRSLRELTGITAELRESTPMSGFYSPKRINRLGIGDIPRMDVWIRKFTMPETVIQTEGTERIADLDSGAPGVVLKRHGSWCAIFIAGTAQNATTPEFWRAAARLADTKSRCAPGDVFAAGSRFVMLHATSSGDKQITMPPGTAAVRDAIDGTPVKLENGSVKFFMRCGETRVLERFR